MSYDDVRQHQARESAGSRPASRHDVDDTAALIDAATPQQRDVDSRSGDPDGAFSRARGEVNALDQAFTSELVDSETRLISVISQWIGDLPHPRDLERYEKLQPGTTALFMQLKARQIDLAERELALQRFRHSTVREAVQSEARANEILARGDVTAIHLGQWLAWSVSIVACAITVLGVLTGHSEFIAAILVPVIQASASLIRTVTDRRQLATGNGSPELTSSE